MAALHFTVDIKAPVQKVRYNMISDSGYRIWSAPFNPSGSRFEGSREKGTEIRFLGASPENPDKIGGMFTIVAENKLFEFISLQHKGEIMHGVVTMKPERGNAYENYTFSEKDGVTTVAADLNMGDFDSEDMISYMKEAWPKALDVLKTMSEVPFKPITVKASINAPLSDVRKKWTDTSDIPGWCSGDDSRHTPRAENDLTVGGRFLTRMEAKDGSAGFDWTGTYTKVEPMSHIAYIMDDGRTCTIDFSEDNGVTNIIETFEGENTHTAEQQIEGWQHILNNFKKYVESSSS